MAAEMRTAGLLAALVAASAACPAPPDEDEQRFSDLLAAFADGDCVAVLALRDEGFVVTSDERADAANLAIGVCQYRAGDFARAADTLEDAAQRYPPFPRTPRAAYYHARALQRAGALEDADLAFSEIERRFADSRYLDDALHHHGRCALSLRRPDEALALYQRLADLPGVVDVFAARALYGRGRAHQMKGEQTGSDDELESAVALYGEVRSRFPTADVADNALYRTGKVRRLQLRLEEAIGFFDTLVADHPTSRWVPSALYQKGRCQLDLGQAALATVTFAQVVEEHPEASVVDNALYRWGRAHYARGLQLDAEGGDGTASFASAEERLGALISEYPDSLFVRGAAYYSGRARYHLRNWTGARARMDQVLALGPSSYDDNASFYREMVGYHLALSTADYEAVAAALAGFVAAFADSSYVDNALYFRGRSLHRALLLEEAAEVYLALASSFPESIYADNALYYRIVALVALGRCDDAQATFTWLVFTAPDSSWRPQAETLLLAACPG